MPDQRSKAKLSAKLKVKVLIMIATGYNARIIADYLNEEHGITISTQALYKNYIHSPRYKGRIRSLRNILDKNLMAHPLASKQNRLDILNKAIHECMTWRLAQINYDKDGNELSRVEKRQMQAVATMIREARIEIEGDKSKDTGTIETVLIELIRKADKENTDVKGFRITRRELNKADSYLSGRSSSLL